MQLNTIYLAIDVEQIDKLIYDLRQARMLGARSALLMTSNKPEAQSAMEQIMHLGTATLDDMPEPDVIIMDAVWTVGLPATIERLRQLIEEWSA
jgi:hypothetical protein